MSFYRSGSVMTLIQVKPCVSTCRSSSSRRHAQENPDQRQIGKGGAGHEGRGPAQTGRRRPNDERREQPLRGAHMQAPDCVLPSICVPLAEVGGRKKKVPRDP
jgi:hypothetical protein